MNRFIGIGRWSKEIDMRHTGNGTAVASSTLAINEKSGGNDNTVFLPVVMWQKLAENVANYSGKGRLVCVEGRLSQREYENRDGQKVKVWEVVANSVQFLERSDSSGQSTSRNTTTSQPTPRYEDDPFASDEPLDISDDDLPF